MVEASEIRATSESASEITVFTLLCDCSLSIVDPLFFREERSLSPCDLLLSRGAPMKPSFPDFPSGAAWQGLTGEDASVGSVNRAVRPALAGGLFKTTGAAACARARGDCRELRPQGEAHTFCSERECAPSAPMLMEMSFPLNLPSAVSFRESARCAPSGRLLPSEKDTCLETLSESEGSTEFLLAELKTADSELSKVGPLSLFGSFSGPFKLFVSMEFASLDRGEGR
mmetsp:Transcript_5103/g.15269  ORF Transcript_5103/g.15269 Transcript_5103/m.15269 type:complete len:228 (-) Transcript_5103:309-992(-)|eukprot:CAMPEP_0198726100 /NCGR_PEP_ID=MMETSP1475-20131203/3268_1 /TAXON_ID= ORGANISM="Unidentified sp., Strain CCMP1999" /NCGR_SAMPLE_ID=MMETSP1475 /ASSEMBLY_ACC=CAM_ASM_001111 /LENGTH=227 /DNA_ID=CAMNT_0044487989 /DNA_START=667 /DNA_END=1350 /DNA_ORIENTATION=+